MVQNEPIACLLRILTVSIPSHLYVQIENWGRLKYNDDTCPTQLPTCSPPDVQSSPHTPARREIKKNKKRKKKKEKEKGKEKEKRREEKRREEKRREEKKVELWISY